MGAFTNVLKNHVSKMHRDLKATKHVARYAANNGNASLIGSLISPITKYKPFGGDIISSGFNNIGYAANRLDTAIGSLLRGNAKPGSLRYNFFTETSHSTLPQVKDKVTGALRLPKAGETPDFQKIVPRASATTSLSTPVILFTSGAAVSTLSDALRSDYPEDQAQPLTYNKEVQL